MAGQNLIPYIQVYNVTLDQASLKPAMEVTYLVKAAGKVIEKHSDLTGESVQFFSGQRVVVIGRIPLTTIAPAMAHPTFKDPMYKPLRDISADHLVPNLDLIPNNTVSLAHKEALQTLRLLERLEDLDDVQKVYSNADFPEEAIEEYNS